MDRSCPVVSLYMPTSKQHTLPKRSAGTVPGTDEMCRDALQCVRCLRNKESRHGALSGPTTKRCRDLPWQIRTFANTHVRRHHHVHKPIGITTNSFWQHPDVPPHIPTISTVNRVDFESPLVVAGVPTCPDLTNNPVRTHHHVHPLVDIGNRRRLRPTRNVVAR